MRHGIAVLLLLLPGAVFSQSVISVTAGMDLQAAIDGAPEGAIVEVGPNVWPYTTVSKRITLRSTDPLDRATRSETIIRGIALEADNVTIEGFTISGASVGIYARENHPDYAIIRNNVIASINGNGIEGFDRTNYGWLIVNNIIVDNSGWGIVDINGTAVGNVTINNTIVNNGNGSILDVSGILKNNIGFDLPGSNITVPAETLDLNYRLIRGSPAIDAGEESILGPTQFDIDGDARVMGDRIDIGADEFLEVPDLLVEGEGFVATGLSGGPFAPSNASFLIRNSGEAPITWSANTTQDWTSLSISDGVLPPGESQLLIVSTNSATLALGAGTWTDTLFIINQNTNGASTTLPITITISPNPELDGDVNKDGSVDALDLTALIDILNALRAN